MRPSSLRLQFAVLQHSWLVAVALLPLALSCSSTSTESGVIEADDSGTTRADTNETSDSADSTSPCDDLDTGFVFPFWSVAFESSEGAFESATASLSFYGTDLREVLCAVDGTLQLQEDAPSGCPDCLWSWDLSGLTDPSLHGAYCDLFNSPSDAAQFVGAVDYSWGFANSYTLLVDDNAYYFEDALFIYVPEYGWIPTAMNYAAASNYEVYGTAESLRAYLFHLPAYDWDDRGYYYLDPC